MRVWDDVRGSLLSVALSSESPRLGVTQRPALWSSDFPPNELLDSNTNCANVFLPLARQHNPDAMLGNTKSLT